MLATSSDNTTVATVVFQVFPVLDGEIIDMTSGISATAPIKGRPITISRKLRGAVDTVNNLN